MRKKFQPDYIFIISLGIILFIGMIFLVSISSPWATRQFHQPFYFFKHQLFFGLIPGLILFFVLSRLDYHFYKKCAGLLFVFTLLLLFLVFVPGLGLGRGISRRWLKMGNFSFQPAELAKLTFLIYLAAWLDKKGKDIKKWGTGFGQFLVLLFLISLPILLHRHLSILAIIFFISLLLFFLAGARLIHLLIISGLILVIIFSMIIFTPFRLARFWEFLGLTTDRQSTGYHLQQALIAIGSGGFIGRGLGGSGQKFLYLPEAFGDSIFAVIAEELGFIGILIFVLLYGFFIYRGLRIARAAPDSFGYLLASGIMFWIFIQALINIGAMLGLMPLTGVPLPLISYGGSAISVLLAALGVVVNISSQSRKINSPRFRQRVEAGSL